MRDALTGTWYETSVQEFQTQLPTAPNGDVAPSPYVPELTPGLGGPGLPSLPGPGGLPNLPGTWLPPDGPAAVISEPGGVFVATVLLLAVAVSKARVILTASSTRKA
ncbi:hypothetical protein [Roseomonas sp. WA12]